MWEVLYEISSKPRNLHSTQPTLKILCYAVMGFNLLQHYAVVEILVTQSVSYRLLATSVSEQLSYKDDQINCFLMAHSNKKVLVSCSCYKMAVHIKSSTRAADELTAHRELSRPVHLLTHTQLTSILWWVLHSKHSVIICSLVTTQHESPFWSFVTCCHLVTEPRGSYH
jgi:hypothetical protein